jgi:hypothetical protein
MSFIIGNPAPTVTLLEFLPKRRIRRHAEELGGAPGAEVSGLEQVGRGDRIRYQHGAIDVGPNTEPAWVHGAIGERYDSLGTSTSLLGLPTTDELPTPRGPRRFNHFEGGSDETQRSRRLWSSRAQRMTIQTCRWCLTRRYVTGNPLSFSRRPSSRAMTVRRAILPLLLVRGDEELVDQRMVWARW